MTAVGMPYEHAGPVIVVHIETAPGSGVALCAPMRLYPGRGGDSYPGVPRVPCTGCHRVAIDRLDPPGRSDWGHPSRVLPDPDAIRKIRYWQPGPPPPRPAPRRWDQATPGQILGDLVAEADRALAEHVDPRRPATFDAGASVADALDTGNALGTTVAVPAVRSARYRDGRPVGEELPRAVADHNAGQRPLNFDVAPMIDPVIARQIRNGADWAAQHAVLHDAFLRARMMSPDDVTAVPAAEPAPEQQAPGRHRRPPTLTDRLRTLVAAIRRRTL